jgi:hypothetical protein
MYYDEKLINGVLHYRIDPKGDWLPVSPEEITRRLINSTAESFRLIEALQEIIGFNRDEAGHRYGDSDKAENWACVKVARAAINDFEKNHWRYYRWVAK